MSHLASHPENCSLFADPFTAADQQFLAGLCCGDEPWAQAATEWIKSSEVLDSIDRYDTKVWVYRRRPPGDRHRRLSFPLRLRHEGHGMLSP